MRRADVVLLLLALLGGRAVIFTHAQPKQCAPGCTDRGNCNTDTGECICPYGWEGKACEVDALSACRMTPDGPALCGWWMTKNCECFRQCERFHCRQDGGPTREGPCEMAEASPTDRGCFMRDGVPPEKQNSKAPERDEAGVRYFKGWKDDAPEVPSTNSSGVTEVMRWQHIETKPLSACPNSCNLRGFCYHFWQNAEENPYCVCFRGYKGTSCEEEEPLCLAGCSGRGKCTDKFCHCKPPFFGLGCTRNSSAPATSQPNPATFKIYMYELPTHLAYSYVERIGGGREEEGMGIYIGYAYFMELFLNSTVRTEDPSEAHMFYVPALTYTYSKMTKDGTEHLRKVLDHISQAYPYWNRTQGKDHFFFQPQDRGGCHLEGLSLQAVKILHMGYYHPDPKSALLDTVRDYGTGAGYSCFHPQRDVLAVPHDNRIAQWVPRSKEMSIDDILLAKNKLLFFSGGGVEYYHDPQFSGNVRQILNKLIQQWKDPDIVWWDTEKDHTDYHDYEGGFREAKFCLAPYGWGWGIRLSQAVVLNCIPVIVQERVFQAYEDLLPYETFSLRLNNADLPNIREILRNITDVQYRGMMEQLVQYRDAFHWRGDLGGRAFDFTIASLRRRYLNMKALYY